MVFLHTVFPSLHSWSQGLSRKHNSKEQQFTSGDCSREALYLAASPRSCIPQMVGTVRRAMSYNPSPSNSQVWLPCPRPNLSRHPGSHTDSASILVWIVRAEEWPCHLSTSFLLSRSPPLSDEDEGPHDSVLWYFPHLVPISPPFIDQSLIYPAQPS